MSSDTNASRYANPHVQYMSEAPRTADEMVPIIKPTRYGAIVASPTQIIREGDWVGVWRVTRVWRNGRHLGYVRIDLDVMTVRARLEWDVRELSPVLSIKPGIGAMSIPTALQRACEMLTLVRAAYDCDKMNK